RSVGTNGLSEEPLHPGHGEGLGRRGRDPPAHGGHGAGAARLAPAPGTARPGGGSLMWGVAYVVLLATLLVRVRTEDVPPPAPVHPLPGEPLWITRLHHALFTLLVVG